MSIVVLIVPEENRRIFTNKLYRATNGDVRLVVVQNGAKRNPSLFGQIKNFYKSGGLANVFVELWFAVLLRILRHHREVLNYFREREFVKDREEGFLAETLEVDSHNDKEVLEVLKKLSPNLLVVWSNTIIRPEILATAKRAINIHMGLCPYYRGSVANQYALMLEPERVGATVHYVEAGVDTGDIIQTILANLAKPPKEMFRDLNERAEKLYLEIAVKLHLGEKLKREPQNKSVGKNFMLKDWTPKMRFRLAKIIVDWENRGSLTK